MTHPRLYRHQILVALCLAIVALLALPRNSFAGKEPKKRVAVIDFRNEAGYRYRHLGDLGGGMSEKLAEALLNTDKFVVLERQALRDVLYEHQLGDIAYVEPGVIGRLTSAQALIRGVITNVEGAEAEEVGGLRVGKFTLSGKNQKVTVKVNLRVIDTVTGQVLQSQTVEGLAKLRGLRIRKGWAGTDIKINRDHPVGKALDDAVAKAVVRIVDGMESIPWQGSISHVSGRFLYINAGAEENVESGLKLKVFERGAEIIDQDTNESLGHLDEQIGTIRIVQVEGKLSKAEIVDGQGFAKGNIVRPLIGP